MRPVHYIRGLSQFATCLLAVAFCRPALGQTATAPSTQASALVAQAQSHLTVGMADWNAGRYDQALQQSQILMKLYKQAYGDAPNAYVARTYWGLGNCLVDLNRPAEALPDYQACLAMYRAVYGNGDRRETAFAVGKLGWCEHLLGQDEEGDKQLVEAADIIERIAEAKPAADLVTDLSLAAVSLEAMDRADDALPMRRDAMNLAEQLCGGRDDVTWAIQMDNLAQCYSDLGQFAEALPYYQDATRMGRRLTAGTDSPEMAVGIEHVGDCLNNMGRYADGLPLLRESLAMRSRIAAGRDDPNVVQGMNMVAVCLSNMGQMKEALPMHQAALAMDERLSGGKDSATVAYCRQYVALDLMVLGRADESLPYLQSALAMRRRIFGDRDGPVLSESMAYLSVNYLVLHRDKEALATMEPATAMAERIKSPYLFMYNRVLGGLRLRMGDASGAAAAFQRGIDSIEEFRESLGGDDEDRMNVMNAYQGFDPYSGMVRAQVELGHADAAAEFLDQGRARSLLDKLERGERLSNGDLLDPMKKKARLTGNAEELKEILDVRQEVDAAEDQVCQLTSQINRARALNTDAGLEQIKALQPKLDAAYQAYADAHRRKFNLAGQTTYSAPATSLQIQSLLGPGQHLLMYSFTPKDAVLLVIPPSGKAVEGMYLTEPDGKTRIPGQEIQRLIRDYRQAVVARGMSSVRGVRRAQAPGTTRPVQDESAMGYQLFKDLMPANIWKEIQGDDLVYVVPDASMAGLPLEMLILEKPAPKPGASASVYWIDEGPLLCYGPSAAALLELRRQEPDRTGRTYTHEAVLLGDPILQRSEQVRQPPPKAGAFVTTVQAGSEAEKVGLTKGAVIVGYGPISIADSGSFDDAVDKLELMQFHGKLTTTPKLKFWVNGTVLERELSLDSPPGVQLADMTPELAATLVPPPVQPMASVAMRGADVSRYGAMDPLPGTKLEVTGIYQVLTGQPYTAKPDDSVVVLLGEDATNENLEKAASGTRYLHLATHGLVKSGDEMLYSSVVLSQPEVVTPQDTGMLTLEDLFDHWWGKLDGTELVVLSACDSEGLDEDRSNAYQTEGVYGLPWGFMYAGSPAVVASLWEVQDASTAELMQKFYGAMKAGDEPSKLAAFTEARKELKKDFPEPFFWAPFIYLGDPG